MHSLSHSLWIVLQIHLCSSESFITTKIVGIAVYLWALLSVLSVIFCVLLCWGLVILRRRAIQRQIIRRALEDESNYNTNPTDIVSASPFPAGARRSTANQKPRKKMDINDSSSDDDGGITQAQVIQNHHSRAKSIGVHTDYMDTNQFTETTVGPDTVTTKATLSLKKKIMGGGGSGSGGRKQSMKPGILNLQSVGQSIGVDSDEDEFDDEESTHAMTGDKQTHSNEPVLVENSSGNGGPSSGAEIDVEERLREQRKHFKLVQSEANLGDAALQAVQGAPTNHKTNLQIQKGGIGDEPGDTEDERRRNLTPMGELQINYFDLSKNHDKHEDGTPLAVRQGSANGRLRGNSGATLLKTELIDE